MSSAEYRLKQINRCRYRDFPSPPLQLEFVSFEISITCPVELQLFSSPVGYRLNRSVTVLKLSPPDCIYIPLQMNIRNGVVFYCVQFQHVMKNALRAGSKKNILNAANEMQSTYSVPDFLLLLKPNWVKQMLWSGNALITSTIRNLNIHIIKINR